MKFSTILFVIFLFINIYGNEYLFTKRENNYLREGGGAYHKLITILPLNEKMLVLEKKGSWLKIELHDGTTGWIANNSTVVQKSNKNIQKTLSKTWSSSSASKSGLAAAIKGFKGKSGNTSTGNIDALVASTEITFSESDFRYFKSAIDKKNSSNVNEVDLDDLDLDEIEYDPNLLELQIGMGIASRFIDEKIIYDRKLNRYLNLIAATLVEKSEFYDFNFNVLAIDIETVDGYACPGGYIFITTGAIKSCKSEAELAGLIGHEIAHVIRKHGLQEMTNRKVQIKSDDVFAELDEETGDRNYKIEADLENMMLSGYEKVVHERLLDYELEADKISAMLCANAGYNPFGLGKIVTLLAHRFVDNSDIFDDSYMAPNDMRTRSNALMEFLSEEFEKDSPGADLKYRLNQYIKL